MEHYQDLTTLEGRVIKAGRAVYANAQRREMERESQRRVAAGAGGLGGAVEDGVRWVRYIHGVEPADRYFATFDVTGERTSAIGGVSLRGCNAVIS